METLTLERGAIGRVELFVVKGSIEMATIEPLERSVDEAVARGARYLLFDLTALDFLDSTVLRLLARTRKAVHERDGALAVAAAGPVSRAFRITGLDHAYSVDATREAALARLAGPVGQG